MYGWLSSRNYRRHKRAIVKLLRDLNKEIMLDNIWRGRFECRLMSTQWAPYEDGSGADLYCSIIFYDKFTKQAAICYGTVNEFRRFNGIYLAFNRFVTEYINARLSDITPAYSSFTNEDWIEVIKKWEIEYYINNKWAVVQVRP